MILREGMTLGEKFSVGLTTMILGILVVFSVLLIIMLILQVIGAAFAAKDKKAAKKAAAAFPDADIEIVEAHHNRKVDAPSGTAVMLANSIKEVRPDAEYVYGRGGEAKRTPNEIGIHALRMANIVGEHEVYITTDSQQLVLRHNAYDRSLFADGAVVF